MEKIKLSFWLKTFALGFFVAVISAFFIIKVVTLLNTITMPDFTGLSYEKAGKIAKHLKLDLKVENEVYDNVYDTGAVLSQDIKPKLHIKRGRTIYVVISKGSKMVKVPEITGINYSNAILVLKQLGLDIGFEAVIDTKLYNENTVLSQFPPVGADVPYGYKISILKCSGKENSAYKFPNFTGKNIYTVTGVLKQHEIYPQTLTTIIDDALDSGTVTQQSPDAGYMLTKDTPVFLTISRKTTDKNLKGRLVNISYTLEGAGTAKLVKINLFDITGSKIIFNQMMQPGETTELKESMTGDGLVQVFIGPLMVKEIDFK